MKKHKIIIACTIVSAFMLAGCGSKEDTQAIAELQSAVDDLQSQVDAYSELRSDLEAANDSIAELQSQIDTVTAEKDAMASKLEALYYIEAMDETMYIISEADIYDGLYDGVLGSEASGTISTEQEIKVTGKSNIIDWYEIDVEGTKKYVSGALVSTTRPVRQSGGGSGGNSGGTTQQPSGGGNGGGGSSQQPADTGSGDGGIGASLGLPEVGTGGVGSGGGSGLNWTTD